MSTNQEFQRQRKHQARERLTRAVACALCLSFLVLAALAEHFHAGGTYEIVFLYLVSYIAGGFYSLRNALVELREGKVNVDLLMVLAAGGAAAVQEWPEGATLLFLFSLSGTLEQYVLARTRSAIEKLMDLTPEEAVVLRNSIETRVPVEELQIGDVILVRPGEKISGEGTILHGSTSIDQSAMTGESIPVERSEGDSVFAGTLNQEGAIQVQITRRAHETTLARIIQLVEQAQNARADTQRFTDWFGQRYTFFVLGLASATGLLYYFGLHFPASSALYRAMTVLVVASPCAVVISIPAAILSAIAAAAREGVLFKGGVHLEHMGSLRAIAFDKTGTLTLGKPQVTHLHAVPGMSEEELLSLAAAGESQSEHPLARAIVTAAKEKGLVMPTSTDLQAIIGKGVSVKVDGREILIGKPVLFESIGIEISDFIKKAAHELLSTGNTCVYLGDKTKVLGVLGLADTLRPAAVQTIRELRSLGLEKLVMLTGDSEAVARRMSETLEIEYKSDLMPEDKVNAIHALRERYQKVGMVGDGINDAPSLAASTLGMSLGGTGTAVALETADVVLMGDNLALLPYAIRLSRKTLRTIKQNLVFAFGAMLLLLLATFSGSLRLPFAVAGHEGSTVLVILNGLRLLRRSK